MGKKYEEEKPEKRIVSEPMIPYGTNTEREILPPLTKEELKNCITTEELLESVYTHIDKLFDNRK